MNSIVEKRLVYGTSGFRSHADRLIRNGLTSPIVRTAFYAAKRSRLLQKTLGIMITASHNPIEDNGIKLVDPDGSMLASTCEHELEEFVNDLDDEDFKKCCNDYFNDLQKEERDCGTVLVATDTRPSSTVLLKHVLHGLTLARRVSKVFENHTTPQLHFFVRAANDSSFCADFVSQFNEAIRSFLEFSTNKDLKSYTPNLIVDCANGVGSLWVKKYFGSNLFSNADSDKSAVNLQLINADVNSLMLNKNCGADFVKIEKKAPNGLDSFPVGTRCASLDGDADRVVYFHILSNFEISILDGDHIAALFSLFIHQQLEKAKAAGTPLPLTFGVVQTAYSNGNSTRYFREQLDVSPVIVKTGVKHLEEAARKFDIGVYFEANGHGTVCFSSKFHKFVTSFENYEPPLHIRLLHIFSKLVNEVVGDGIADILAIEMLLRYFDWSAMDWENNTFTIQPSVQLKVCVKDRSLFCSSINSEIYLVKPSDIQDKIEAILSTYKDARAFVRPSGTEEIVRIYTEASSYEDAQNIASQIFELIKEIEQDS